MQQYEHLELFDERHVEAVLAPFEIKSAREMLAKAGVVQRPAAKFELIAEDQRWQSNCTAERSLMKPSAIFVVLLSSLRNLSPQVPFAEKSAFGSAVVRNCLACSGSNGLMQQPRPLRQAGNGTSAQEERARALVANRAERVEGPRQAEQSSSEEVKSFALARRLMLGTNFQDVFLVPTVLGLQYPSPSRSQSPQPQQYPVRDPAMDAFVRVCQRWNLNEAEALTLLGYRDSPFLGKQILDSRSLSIPLDARDRSSYLLSISLGLGTMFNEVAESRTPVAPGSTLCSQRQNTIGVHVAG